MKPGTFVAHYRITSKLGEGGMGAVYRATDTKLDREVAIKILPDDLAQNPNRLARFEREAKVMASLSHPNIAQIYGVEDRALVMELIAGNTVQGPLPVETVLQYAKQIAEALEAAHDKGIVHRDLKPANILVTSAGMVKVLDFGLAAVAKEPVPGSPDSNERTLSMGSTRAGVIMGSAGYMAPEQARGQAVDKRADIWSFGVVLYEMLTGKSLFGGATITDSIAAILTREPDLTVLPHRVRRLLQKCLEKDPKKRLRDIADWQALLDEGHPEAEKRPAAKLPWAVAALLGVCATAAFALYLGSRKVANEIHLDIATPPTNSPASFAVSPDGEKIVYLAESDGAQRLWVRSLDLSSAQPLAGTENAALPFWSPDSRSVGFFADFKLKRIDLGGGRPTTLVEVHEEFSQASWGGDGSILFNEVVSPLYRVSAFGGEPAIATKLGTGQLRHAAPRFLPGGSQFLFVSDGSDRAIWLGSLYPGGIAAEPRRIAAAEIPVETSVNVTAAEYIEPGWLIRVRQNVLVAQKFDKRGKLLGESFPLLRAGGSGQPPSVSSFSTSFSGLIAWRGGVSRRQLTWFDRSGKKEGVVGDPDDQNLFNPELSPDARRVAVTRGPIDSGDIWLLDDRRPTKFTFGAADDRFAVWSPDGARVVFSSFGKDRHGLYQHLADGSGSDEVLLDSAEGTLPNSWSSDGKYILYYCDRNNGDLMVLPLFGDRKPIPFMSTPATEQAGIFSPDGKWVAYQSNESGMFQVYVRPFPGQGGQGQVSTAGGDSPRWRRDGKELYYRAPDRTLMAVAISTKLDTLAPGTPRRLFQVPISRSSIKPQYDIAPNGRFLIKTELLENSAEPIHLLLNWKPPR